MWSAPFSFPLEVSVSEDDLKTWEVPIHYKGMRNFVVKAKTREEAVEEARRLNESGDNGTVLGTEYEDVVDIGSVEEIA